MVLFTKRNRGVAVGSLKVSGHPLILGAVLLPVVAPSSCDDHYRWKWQGLPISPTIQATNLCWAELHTNPRAIQPAACDHSKQTHLCYRSNITTTQCLASVVSLFTTFHSLQLPPYRKTVKFLTRGISFSCCYQ